MIISEALLSWLMRTLHLWAWHTHQVPPLKIVTRATSLKTSPTAHHHHLFRHGKHCTQNIFTPRYIQQHMGGVCPYDVALLIIVVTLAKKNHFSMAPWGTPIDGQLPGVQHCPSPWRTWPSKQSTVNLPVTVNYARWCSSWHHNPQVAHQLLTLQWIRLQDIWWY